MCAEKSIVPAIGRVPTNFRQGLLRAPLEGFGLMLLEAVEERDGGTAVDRGALHDQLPALGEISQNCNGARAAVPRVGVLEGHRVHVDLN